MFVAIDTQNVFSQKNTKTWNKYIIYFIPGNNFINVHDKNIPKQE